MTISEIINEIERQDCVEDVSKILLDILIRRNQKAEKGLAEARSCLRMIHSINNMTKRNEQIDALSEV